MDQYEKAARRGALYEFPDLKAMRASMKTDQELVAHLLKEIDAYKREVSRLNEMLHAIQNCMGYEFS